MYPDHFLVYAVTFLLLFPGFYSTMAVTTLQSFRGCAVRDFAFLAKKPGCRSLRINTEACWGRCHTWEVTRTCYIQLIYRKIWEHVVYTYLFLRVLYHRGQFQSHRISRGTTVSVPTAEHGTWQHVYQAVALASPQSIITLRPYSVTAPTAPQTTQSVKPFKGTHTYTQLIHTHSLLCLLCKKIFIYVKYCYALDVTKHMSQ